jgi:hypothetical protein
MTIFLYEVYNTSLMSTEGNTIGNLLLILCLFNSLHMAMLVYLYGLLPWSEVKMSDESEFLR